MVSTGLVALDSAEVSLAQLDQGIEDMIFLNGDSQFLTVCNTGPREIELSYQSEAYGIAGDSSITLEELLAGERHVADRSAQGINARFTDEERLKVFRIVRTQAEE